MSLNAEIKDFWEGESVVYSRGIQEELEGAQKQVWKDLILGNAPAGDHLEILDSGCGPGFFPIILSEEGHHVTGIDITENMIARAKENLEAAGGKAELMTMDCQALSFPDNTFDLVVCRNITWTLDDPRKAYAEWLRVLKPGGRVLVFDACWYRHLYDEELGKKYRENEARVREKYGRNIHEHADKSKEESLSRKLFMSDKIRPLWDLEFMISLGFAKVFSEINIGEKIWDERGWDFGHLNPPFMVGGEK